MCDDYVSANGVDTRGCVGFQYEWYSQKCYLWKSEVQGDGNLENECYIKNIDWAELDPLSSFKQENDDKYL